jgi:hypothetical protein
MRVTVKSKAESVVSEVHLREVEVDELDPDVIIEKLRKAPNRNIILGCVKATAEQSENDHEKSRAFMLGGGAWNVFRTLQECCTDKEITTLCVRTMANLQIWRPKVLTNFWSCASRR